MSKNVLKVLSYAERVVQISLYYGLHEAPGGILFMDHLRRIAFLSEHATPLATLGGADAGGQNVYVSELSQHLSHRGYIVDVFTRHEDPNTPEMVAWKSGVRIVNLKAGPIRPLPKDKLWPLMPEFRNSLQHFMQYNKTHYDLIHSNFWMAGWVATNLRRRFAIPVVQIFHAMGKTKRYYQQEADSSPVDRIKTEMNVIREVDKIIAPCPNEQAELINDYGAEPNKIELIPLGVNTRIFYPVARDEARQRIGLETKRKVIIYVGRILPRKDIRNVVQALALLLRWDQSVQDAPMLMIVGGESIEPDPSATPEIGELQKLVAELGITDKVHFVGKRQAEVLRYYYSAADVAVTTPWYEPFGLTTLEAMACGRPVIGSAVGGIKYTINDGETGFLVPPRYPEALATLLQQLLSQPESCKRMGQAARKRIEREFSWSIVAMRTETLYEKLLVSK